MLSLLGIAVAAPLFVRPSNQVVLTDIVLTAMMCLSLVVLTGYAGHVSLGQFALVGIGAAAGGRLYQLGVPHLPAAARHGARRRARRRRRLAGVANARVVPLRCHARPRLGHEQLALVPKLVRPRRPRDRHVDGSARAVPRHRLRRRSYYWLCLSVAIVTGWIVYRIRHTSMGRAMIAVRENEQSAASMAQSPRRVKLSAFPCPARSPRSLDSSTGGY